MFAAYWPGVLKIDLKFLDSDLDPHMHAGFRTCSRLHRGSEHRVSMVSEDDRGVSESQNIFPMSPDDLGGMSKIGNGRNIFQNCIRWFAYYRPGVLKIGPQIFDADLDPRMHTGVRTCGRLHRGSEPQVEEAIGGCSRIKIFFPMSPEGYRWYRRMIEGQNISSDDLGGI